MRGFTPPSNLSKSCTTFRPKIKVEVVQKSGGSAHVLYIYPKTQRFSHFKTEMANNQVRLAVLVGGTKSIEKFDQKRKMPKTYTESIILYHPGPDGDFVPPFLL